MDIILIDLWKYFKTISKNILKRPIENLLNDLKKNSKTIGRNPLERDTKILQYDL